MTAKYDIEDKGTMFCGIDEAGRGPVMGPLVVTAVFVEDDDRLRTIGVKDSKKLSPSVRERMYHDILRAAEHRTIILSAEEIDAKRADHSMNEIELQMFAAAASEKKVSRVYADCPDVNVTAFASSLSAKLGGTKVIAEHGADNAYPVVSAASVIAKVTRDRIISEISKEFGTDIGSGYPSDQTTIGFIAKWIKENGDAPPHTRRSWETVRKMLTVSMNSKITDW